MEERELERVVNNDYSDDRETLDYAPPITNHGPMSRPIVEFEAEDGRTSTTTLSGKIRSFRPPLHKDLRRFDRKPSSNPSIGVGWRGN